MIDRRLWILVLCVACAGSPGSDDDDDGDDFRITDEERRAACGAMDIEALERHPEQAEFTGNAIQALQLGMVFVPEDGLTDGLIAERKFRLHRASGTEVAAVGARATSHWPDGGIKWLQLRWSDGMQRAEEGYVFYWGDDPLCSGSDMEAGSVGWLTDGVLYIDSAPAEGCRQDGSGCSHDGDGLEARVEIAGDQLLDWVAIDGVDAVSAGIKPILQGIRRTDSSEEDYSTSVVWDPAQSQVSSGRPGAEVTLAGALHDDDTGQRVAWLEVRLDVRRDRPVLGISHSFTWLEEGEATGGFAWDSPDSSVDLDITCSIPQVQEWHYDRTIGRLGLLLRGDEGDITSVAWGDCATEGEDRLCADPERRSTESIALGETLDLRQEGPHSHRVNGGEAVASPLGGWLAALGPEASIEVAVQHFWQTYPSGFEVRDSGISIDLYPDWAPDWTFSFFEEDGTPDEPLLYKPLPGHDVPGEESCLGEDIPGLSDMDFYTHFLQGNMTDEGDSTGCLEDHLKRAQVVSHGAGRTHQLELAFYPAEEGLLDRGAKRASMLNHPVILRQDPAAALRVNFLGLMMVPAQDGEDYRAMEEALEEVLHLNALRFRCRHDFGFWHFGKVQGHYGRERLDRWVDGVQYGHQAIPWLLFLRGGSRLAYEEAMIQSRHALDVPLNKHYLDPDWEGRSVAVSDFSASPFNHGQASLGMWTHIDFLAFYRHLGGEPRAGRFLEAFAEDMKAPDESGDPRGTHYLSSYDRSNFVPNAMWAVLNEEVPDPELAAFEARWLQRTFSIDDAPEWQPNYLPQAANSDHPGYDPEADGVLSPFVHPRKGLERGLLAQWARGNMEDEYWPYLFDHSQESGFVPELWRGLNRSEAIQLGPMLTEVTGDTLHARRSWTHADRIARSMPRWDGLVRDAAEPVDHGFLYPMLTPWFGEGYHRDLTHALLAGLSSRSRWDEEGAWVDGHFADSVFRVTEGCAHAWIRPDAEAGEGPLAFRVVADGNTDNIRLSWSVTVDVLEQGEDGAVQSILSEPLVLTQPAYPESYWAGFDDEGEGVDNIANLHMFPESRTAALELDLIGGKDYLVVARYAHPEADDQGDGFFQIVSTDGEAKVLHERPRGAEFRGEIGLASQGVNKRTNYEMFTGASALVRLEPAESSASLEVFDVVASRTEPFSFRDATGQFVRLDQTATYSVTDHNLKQTVEVAPAPTDWLELTTLGQGMGKLGLYGDDGTPDAHVHRSSLVPAVLDPEHWFELDDSGWRTEGELPGCSD